VDFTGALLVKVVKDRVAGFGDQRREEEGNKNGFEERENDDLTLHVSPVE
jgi:hypothetical protein